MDFQPLHNDVGGSGYEPQFEPAKPTTHDTDPAGVTTKWNWGAFTYPTLFAIGTSAWLCLIALIPILNLVWYFVAGAKGEQWAWESGKYKNRNEFRAVMDSWNKAGFVMFIVSLVIIAVFIVFRLSMGSQIYDSMRSFYHLP